MIKYSTDGEPSEESSLVDECDDEHMKMKYTLRKEMLYVDIVNTIFKNIQTKEEMFLQLLPIIYLGLQVAAIVLLYTNNVKYTSYILYLSYFVFIYINVCLYTLINQRLNVPELTHMHVINTLLLVCSLCIVVIYIVIHYQLQNNEHYEYLIFNLPLQWYYHLYLCIVLVYISVSFTLCQCIHKQILSLSCYYNITKLCLMISIFVISLVHITIYLSKLHYHYDTSIVDKYLCVSLYLLFTLFVFNIRKDLMFISQSLKVKSEVEFFVDIEDNTL